MLSLRCTFSYKWVKPRFQARFLITETRPVDLSKNISYHLDLFLFYFYFSIFLHLYLIQRIISPQSRYGLVKGLLKQQIYMDAIDEKGNKEKERNNVYAITTYLYLTQNIVIPTHNLFLLAVNRKSQNVDYDKGKKRTY